MLTIKQIRDDKEAAARKLAKKGVDAAPVIEKIITLRRPAQSPPAGTRQHAGRPEQGRQGDRRTDGPGPPRGGRGAQTLRGGPQGEVARASQAELDATRRQELQSAIVSLPNFPAEIVPEGKTAEDNLVVKLVESYTALPENPLPHWELARKYDIIDFDLGVKLTGAGFPVYKGKGARLQRALINYFLDCNTGGRLPRSGAAR